MLEQGAVTAVDRATAQVVARAVVQGVVPAVDQEAALATADQAANQITDPMAADRVATTLMLQPDRLTVAVIMEPLEVEWPAMVQAVVMVSV
jgi:hypothetical protein